MLVNRTLELSDPIEILNASVQLNYPPAEYPCIPLAANAEANVGISPTTFSYIGCEIFPQAVTAVSNETIFLPSPGVFDSKVKSCKQQYNITVPTQEEHKKRYNLTPQDIANSKRILFAAAEFDPVTGVTPMQLLANVATTDRNASRTLFIPQAAHGEDLLRSNVTVKQTVAYSQRVELQILKEWLGMS